MMTEPRWAGWEGGKKAQEERNICTHIADSPFFMRETSTTL